MTAPPSPSGRPDGSGAGPAARSAESGDGTTAAESGRGGATSRLRHHPVVVAAVGALLAAQVVALLLVGSYARESPRLWGFPFFYWYTLLWLGICAASMAACAALTGPGDSDDLGGAGGASAGGVGGAGEGDR